MRLTKTKSEVVTVRKSDDRFLVKNGLVLMPRAGFEIARLCPLSHVEVIRECIANGWLMPVAYVKESDFTWEALCE